MKRGIDRRMTNLVLMGLVVLGMTSLALLVLAPDYAQAGIDGSQPVSLISGRRANYAIDPLGLAVQQVGFKAVEEIIADRTTSTLPPRAAAATVMGNLKTPVFTITPTRVITRTIQSTATNPARILTITALAFTPTLGGGASRTPTTNYPGPPTATGPAIGFLTPTVASSASATPTSTATRIRLTLPPIATITSTRQATATLKPIPTDTLVPTRPGTTATPTLKPSATLIPTKTYTSTKPPTNLPSLTYTPVPSFTSTSLPPTFTYTPVPPTKTYTYTPVPPTRTNTPIPPTKTYTYTPVPPTKTYTPIPPTKTQSGYPGPNPTSTATKVPYP